MNCNFKRTNIYHRIVLLKSLRLRCGEQSLVLCISKGVVGSASIGGRPLLLLLL